MLRPNFCAECGERVTRKGWRTWWRGSRCDDCAQRAGRIVVMRPLLLVMLMTVAAFGLGRCVRPAPPPLIIQRLANSPLSDLPVNADGAVKAKSGAAVRDTTPAANQPVDENVYVCGARTQKGTPCRRRVHVAGERCYQHKGLKAMVPLEKLTIKP